MAVSSVSGSSSIYGSRNSHILSGLASGLDTESMIEGMVQGTKNKVDKQKQKRQILLWQQEAYRSISDQLVQLSTKYTSYSSSTNLMSSAFFQPSIITSLGANAGMISASGRTNSDIEIASVTHMARNETVSFDGLKGIQNSNSISGSKEIADLTGNVDVSDIAGKQLSFKYGNKTFSVTFDSNREYNSLDDVVDEINTQLGNASITTSGGESISMDTKLEAKNNGGKLELSFKDSGESNTLELLSYSSSDVLDSLHLKAGDKLTSTSGPLTSSEKVEDADLVTSKSVGEVLAGTSMTVNFNGTSATIRMPEQGSPEYEAIFEAPDPNAAMESYLQTQFNQAFGYGRIEVKNIAKNGGFQPEFSVKNDSDTLSITSGSLNLVGKSGIFGIDRGASNRVNTTKTLGDLYGTVDVTQDGKTIVGLAGGMKAIRENGKAKVDGHGNALYAFEINGVEIGKYTADTTLETIMNDINSNEKAGVSVNYSSTTNQFVFTSKHGGEGGQIAIGEQTSGRSDNLAARLFGSVEYTEDGQISTVNGDPVIDDDKDGTIEGTGFSVILGQDAEMTAYINGVQKTLTSGTNTFNIDGFTVTANGTFEAKNANERVTFDAKVDADKIVDAVKSFVEDYNKVLAEINEQYTTQPDADNEYLPLTDDQKAEMSEKQIEEYEAKAKEGLLFGDRDLGGLSNGLRFVFSNSRLSDIGINVSTSYSDKGKITLDETKLRSMLESDPDAVASAFADPLTYTTDADGNTTSSVDTSASGAMAVLKVQLDKYAATTGATKGILIEKAGSQYSPVALLQNQMQEQIDSVDNMIDRLTDKLNDQIDYYTSKFSKLEVLIAQMNSQSSYLAGLGGGSY